MKKPPWRTSAVLAALASAGLCRPQDLSAVQIAGPLSARAAACPVVPAIAAMRADAVGGVPVSNQPSSVDFKGGLVPWIEVDRAAPIFQSVPASVLRQPHQDARLPAPIAAAQAADGGREPDIADRRRKMSAQMELMAKELQASAHDGMALPEGGSDPAYDEILGFPEFQKLPEDMRRAFAEERRLLAGNQIEASAPEVEALFRLFRGDPLAGYEDYSFFMTARSQWSRIPRRIAPADTMTTILARKTLPQKPSLVISDFGHGHSIAMAVMLAESGWKPVVKMSRTGIPLQQIQGPGTMKFYAGRMRAARAQLGPDAPPALILEHHTQRYPPSAFPPAAEVGRLWGNRVAWFVEAPINEVRVVASVQDYARSMGYKMPSGEYTLLPPLPDFLKAYLDAGVQVEAHFVMPYTGGLRDGSYNNVVFSD